jgi:K+-sensing histidine kinase KdpD
MKDTLINMLVHDMRHPLQAIYSYCSFLEGNIATNMSIHEMSIQIKINAYRLNQMLQNFLDIMSLESDRMPLFWEETTLGECLQQCLNRMESLIIQNEIQWDLECKEEKFIFMADILVVGRILDNLVNNAVKYSMKGKSIVLKAMPDEARENVIFQIVDNGPGIEDQYKEKIFEKYEAQKLRLHNKPSVGLGLAFCRLAVQSHKGDIRVEDNPGGGSIFIFYLPVRQEKAITPFDKVSINVKEQHNGNR